MCLVIFAWKTQRDSRLLLAANRDEFHERPSQKLHWWADKPALLAGRDLQAGGTWLAVSRNGRFATVTNYREQQQKKAGLASRGELVTDFVSGSASAKNHISSIDGERYAGFSLLASDGEELCYVSNRGDGPECLSPGIYGLSNASLDTPWTKLVRSTGKLRALLEAGKLNETNLFRIMADRTMAAVKDVEKSDLPFGLARSLTAPFIVSAAYGTRCTTVMNWSCSGDIVLSERRFDAGGRKSGESRFSFTTVSAQARR